MGYPLFICRFLYYPHLEIQRYCESTQVFCLLEMNFWIPGASDPGVDREYEDEGTYLVNDTQNRVSIEQQVSNHFWFAIDSREKTCRFIATEGRFCIFLLLEANNLLDMLLKRAMSLLFREKLGAANQRRFLSICKNLDGQMEIAVLCVPRYSLAKRFLFSPEELLQQLWQSVLPKRSGVC